MPQVLATAYAERKVQLKRRQGDLDAQARFLAGAIRQMAARLLLCAVELLDPAAGFQCTCHG
jgi:hypothetical protein